jgi:hypothetical protein
MTFDNALGLVLLFFVLRAVYRVYWHRPQTLLFRISCDTSAFDDQVNATIAGLNALDEPRN